MGADYENGLIRFEVEKRRRKFIIRDFEKFLEI
jgi:hypothetical protein